MIVKRDILHKILEDTWFVPFLHFKEKEVYIKRSDYLHFAYDNGYHPIGGNYIDGKIFLDRVVIQPDDLVLLEVE